MITRFTVAAVCLLLLTTSSFATDKVAPEVVEGHKVILVSTTDGEHHGQPQVIDLRVIGKGQGSAKKLANLIAELVDSGELSTAGAAMLNALVEALGATHGSGVHGGAWMKEFSHPRMLERFAPPVALADLGGFGHGPELDEWFSEWDNILEDLAKDLSAVQLDRIQNQLDLAKEHLDKMGGMHSWPGQGMLFGPHGPGGVGTLAPGGRHSFKMFMPGPELREGHNFMFAPGLQQGENFEFEWFGHDGKFPFDVEGFMQEIEKMVKELVKEQLAK